MTNEKFIENLRFIDLVILEMMKLKDGEYKQLNKDHKGYNKFVQAVKDIIDYDLVKPLGFFLEFLDDKYDRVYRKPLFGGFQESAEIKTPKTDG